MDEDVRKKIYLKLFYSLIDWEWFHDPNTLVVFIHLLLLANRKPQKYQGCTILRGETLASLGFLANSTGLSIQNVRTALKNLKSTKDITQRKIGKNAVYAIVSFNKWQSSNIISNNELTSNQQCSNNELTTPIDCKNEEIERVREVKTPHGSFGNVFLSKSEKEKLLQTYPPASVNEYISRISMYIESTGKQYKSHYAVILSWMRRDGVQTVKEREGRVLR